MRSRSATSLVEANSCRCCSTSLSISTHDWHIRGFNDGIGRAFLHCGRKQWSGSLYLSWVEMLPKLVFSLVPIPFTTVMMTTEMPAAIRPYSMAVASGLVS